MKLKDETGEVKGCLDVWKAIAANKKWEGSTFRFAWSLRRGNKGFVVYLSAKGEAEMKLKITGATYVFEKKNSKWKTTKKIKFQESNNALTSSNLTDNFPQKKTGILQSNQDKYWKFLNDNGSGLSEAQPFSTNATYWFHSQTGSGAEDASPWHNLDVWWNHFFASWKFSDAIQDIKGKWT